jgi:N-acetylglucosamine-6-phosphate deacetylase
MIIRGARVFDERDGFVSRDIFTDGEFIVADPDGGVMDACGLYAIPGLIDIHTHGALGYEFTSCSSADVEKIARYEASRGVTAFCPTTLTMPEEILSRACGEISSARASDGAAVAGINLEGPFVSEKKLGAQNPAHVRPPDVGMFRRLQAAAKGTVKILAAAPEVEGAMELIRELSGEVACSAAHTAADYVTAMAAFDAGASLVTHLYNAMPPFHHRAPGVIGAAADATGCAAELICDGVHIHPAVVRATLRMFGTRRIVFVSDSMMATGLSDGEYSLGGLAVRVEGRKATLVNGGSIAGSATDLMGCMVTAVRDMGIPLHDAVTCASVNPARVIGASGERGSLSPGRIADVVLLDESLEIRGVVLRGKILLWRR